MRTLDFDLAPYILATSTFLGTGRVFLSGQDIGEASSLEITDADSPPRATGGPAGQNPPITFVVGGGEARPYGDSIGYSGATSEPSENYAATMTMTADRIAIYGSDGRELASVGSFDTMPTVLNLHNAVEPFASDITQQITEAVAANLARNFDRDVARVMMNAARPFPLHPQPEVKMLPEPERPIADSRLHRLVKTKRST
jgi:hypothetical protein